MGYVFFDTETTGLDPAFDQIVQFAAIHTDYDLQERERFQVRARIQPHVVPHPSALRVNGLTIAQLTNRSELSNYEMMREIRRRLVSWSPGIFVGYNSINFDEQVLRHSLFQSLFPAYLTSQHQNGRADAFGLVRNACSVTPGCLTIPRKADGRLSFKLDQLAAANGITHCGAHDALADASAVLDLCRLVKERSDEAWQRFVRFSNKAAVSEFVDNEDGFILTELFGGEFTHRAVVCIGRELTNPNGRFCLDLSTPIETWRAMSDAEVRNEIARKGTPVRRVRVNGAPTLTCLYDATDDALNGLDRVVASTRATQIKADAVLCRRIIDLYTASWAEVLPSPHYERRLYSDGFPDSSDERSMLEFHEASAPERFRLAGYLKDQRLRVFSSRLLHYEHRSFCDAGWVQVADIQLAQRLMNESDGPLTLPAALAEAERLALDPIGDPFGILAKYTEYLQERIRRIGDFRSQTVSPRS